MHKSFQEILKFFFKVTVYNSFKNILGVSNAEVQAVLKYINFTT